MDKKRTTTRHIKIKMSEVKNKKRILKAEKKKQIVTYKEVSIRLSADFSKEICRLEGNGKKYSK